MKQIGGILFFYFIRGIERILSVDMLYNLLKPGTILRAAMRAGFGKAPPPQSLPGCFRSAKSIQQSRLDRVSLHLNRALQCIPDRLALPKWRERCRVSGMEHVEAARQNRQPVIFALCHFGPFYLSRYWLRAVGIPAAALIGGTSDDELLVKKLKDRHAPFPQLRTTFYRDELRDAAKCLADGHALCVAVDFPSGKQIAAPVRDGWAFEMATGAIRLAIRHNALLIPFCLIDEGCWNFRMKLGEPVPRELLMESAIELAGKHLIEQMLPHFETHPEQCPKHLLDHFKQTSDEVARRRSGLPG